MRFDETAAVLAKIKLGDNRQVDNAGLVLNEWHDAIGDLEYSDAIAAVVLHRRESTEYLMPAHIRMGAKRARESREREARKRRPAIEHVPITYDPETHRREFAVALAEHRQQKGAGS